VFLYAAPLMEDYRREWDTGVSSKAVFEGKWLMDPQTCEHFLKWDPRSKPMPESFMNAYIHLLVDHSKNQRKRLLVIDDASGVQLGEDADDDIDEVYFLHIVREKAQLGREGKVGKVVATQDAAQERPISMVVLRAELNNDNTVTVCQFDRKLTEDSVIESGKRVSDRWYALSSMSLTKAQSAKMFNHSPNLFDGEKKGHKKGRKMRKIEHDIVETDITFGGVIDPLAILQYLASELTERPWYLTWFRLEAAKWAMLHELYAGRLRIP
jgi:hypothetical protein